LFLFFFSSLFLFISSDELYRVYEEKKGAKLSLASTLCASDEEELNAVTANQLQV